MNEPTEAQRKAAAHVAKTLGEESMKAIGRSGLTSEETGTLCAALAQSIAVAEKVLIPAGLLDDNENDLRLLRSFCGDKETAQTLIEIARRNLDQALSSPEVARALNQEAAKDLRDDS